jgi:hypothetical protein
MFGRASPATHQGSAPLTPPPSVTRSRSCPDAIRGQSCNCDQNVNDGHRFAFPLSDLVRSTRFAEAAASHAGCRVSSSEGKRADQVSHVAVPNIDAPLSE